MHAVHPRANVDRVIVVPNEDLRALGGDRAFDGPLLLEILDRRDADPRCIVKSAVHPRRRTNEACCGRPFGRRLCVDRWRQNSDQQCRAQDGAHDQVSHVGAERQGKSYEVVRASVSELPRGAQIA